MLDLSYSLAKDLYPFAKVAYLHVVDYNKAAIKFYERNGYTNFCTIKEHY